MDPEEKLSLEESAALIREIYETDHEAQEWVEDALENWPE